MPEKEPRISVLMPVSNSDQYLPQTIESVLKRTFGNYEFLIINDGFTDGPEDIILFCRGNDKRMRYLRRVNPIIH